MVIGNLLTDFNHAIELFKYRSFILFQLDKLVPNILQRVYHLALSFYPKDVILGLYSFMSFREVGDIQLTKKRKLYFTKIKLK